MPRLCVYGLIFWGKIGRVRYMEIRIIKDKISKEELRQLAAEIFGDMIKIVVDIRRGIIAIGGEMHADAESLLLQNGSKQDDLWGANLYPDLPPESFIEYQSLINIRPSLGNRFISIDSEEIKDKVKKIINNLVV